MKKGKCTNVTDTGKTWTSPQGKTLKISTVTINSEGTDYTGETMSSKFVVGQECEFTVENTQYGNKIKYESNYQSGGNYGGGFKKTNNNRSFALSYAKDLVVADKVDIKNIIPIADKLLNWLEVDNKVEVPKEAPKAVEQPKEEIKTDLPF